MLDRAAPLPEVLFPLHRAQCWRNKELNTLFATTSRSLTFRIVMLMNLSCSVRSSFSRSLMRFVADARSTLDARNGEQRRMLAE